MISWMQKHNRYLVWTIWIATIAFIGAGFVGWGSYKLGSNSGKIAKVGDITIEQSRFDMAYRNLYNQYNQQLQGKLDEQKAKEIGIEKQTFAILKAQAEILNLAKEYGIVASDKEVAKTLESFEGFKNNGKFDKAIYEQYLQTQNIKAQTFENMVKDELIINKLTALLYTNATPFEVKAVALPLGISDQIAYSILTSKDVSVSIDDNKLQQYWSNYKQNYMQPKKYSIEILWTPTENINISKEELEAFYKTNVSKFISQDGKQLPFEAVIPFITKELRLQKGEKTAQRAYIDYKKGKIQANEKIVLSANDQKVSPQIINEIDKLNNGDILKPRAVGDKYATIKLISKINPQPMTFDEAKNNLVQDYTKEASKKALQTLAINTLKNFDTTGGKTVKWVSLNGTDNALSLNNGENLQFLQELFTSQKEKGIINLSDKIVVYKIIAQKVVTRDNKEAQMINQSVSELKRKLLEANLLKKLDKDFSTDVYVKGLGLE
ncbi:MAG: peptidylprolyl isomerase [Sulfurovaceae bacterium]|nr:peptidylprolyl isomerase [Sulfurovaceae bacterium]